MLAIYSIDNSLEDTTMAAFRINWNHGGHFLGRTLERIDALFARVNRAKSPKIRTPTRPGKIKRLVSEGGVENNPGVVLESDEKENMEDLATVWDEGTGEVGSWGQASILNF